ncbi:MAG: DNA topoisomerase [Myxococcota bacterium]
MGKRLVITEKPSVARDIAAALGGFTEGEESFESEDFVVTWAVGHLLELAEPKEYDDKWKSWSIKLLPILPEAFQIKPKDGHKKRLAYIKKLGKQKDTTGVINACDAGREGELIFRRIVEYCELLDLPQERLWLQSMTKQAIRDAFDSLRPGTELDNLADAAYLRSVGDWLVGMNATRALTQRLKSGRVSQSWSAGRVQTPTLNLIVRREREILAHEPRPYWELLADFTHSEGDGHEWQGRYHDAEAAKASDDKEMKPTRLFDRALVDKLMAELVNAKVGKASEKRKKSKQKPPLPFDLTSLQREANSRYGISAKRTLAAAQRLYEGLKVITYPRTDSRHLPDDYGPVVDQLLTELQGLPKGDWAEHADIAARIQAAGPENLGKVLDSSKVTDHNAIVPTGNPLTEPLNGDNLRVFDLVVRQFLASLMGPATWATVERFVAMDVGEVLGGKPARFRTTARSLEVAGFLEALGKTEGDGTQLPALMPGHDEANDVQVQHDQTVVEDKETRPPGRFSEAQLLRMMETAGEQLDDDELSDAMKERGLGTPATRADTIEGLIRKQYVNRISSKLTPTAKAMRLIDVLERVDVDGLASPRLTGEWEHALHEVANGERSRSDVEKALYQYTETITKSLTDFEYEELYETEAPIGTCPECGGRVYEQVRGYICENNQGKDQGCPFILWKERYNRYIDRRLAIAVFNAPEHSYGPVLWFKDLQGTQFLDGNVKLERVIKEVEGKDDKIDWVLQVDLGKGEKNTDPEEVISAEAFPCPGEHEGCESCVVVETTHRWVCRCVYDGKQKTGPVLPRKVCQREMEDHEAAAFFGEAAKTELIEDFISKRGNLFKAFLYRKETGKHGFEFLPRGGDKKKDEAGEAKPKRKSTAKKSTAKKSAPRKSAASASSAKKSTSPKKTKRTTSKKAADADAPRTRTPPPSRDSDSKKATRRRLRTSSRSGPSSKTTAVSRIGKNPNS